jgi:hypothetical protein
VVPPQDSQARGLGQGPSEGRWAFYTFDTLDVEALREIVAFIGSLASHVSETRWKPLCCP